MNSDSKRVEEDLKGLLDGDVRADEPTLRLYASDASIYEIQPVAVVRPVNTADVIATVQYAREHQIPLIARGAASNVFGGAIGPGIVMDFSWGMRRVVAIDRDTVTVEPGVPLSQLNRDLAVHHRKFSPDPANRRISTIGGVLSTNGCGSHWTVSGTPRDKVISLTAVLASGQVVTFDSFESATPPKSRDPESVRLGKRIAAILDQHRAEIEAARPQTRINQAGYHVYDLQRSDEVDLTRLLVGSEGTLGMIVQAVLKTDPLPRHRGVALLFFYRLEDAARAAVEINGMGAAACDLMDRRLLTLAVETNSRFSRVIPADAEAMLLVEFESREHSRLVEKLEHLVHRIQRRRKLAFEYRITTQTEERNLYWRLTRRVIPTLYRLRGNERALPFVEDVAIDPNQLPEFLGQAHHILNSLEVTASIFAHTPQGQVHIRPFLDLTDAQDRRRMQELAERLFDHVIASGGTISASHGDGLSRTWYLRKQFGSAYTAFREIKHVFDPQNILNPGKIIDSPPYGLLDNLRVVQPPRVPDDAATDERGLPVLQPVLNWSRSEIAMAARNCNGCARCRTNYHEERMCPIFRLQPLEEASPRAKANLMRAVVTGELLPDALTQDDVKAIADLCVHCHQCRLECPAMADIPRLMVEAKAQYVAANGLKLSEWLLTRIDWIYNLAGRMPRLSNALMRSPTFRAILERLFGVARSRKTPTFASPTFLKWAARNGLTRPAHQQTRKVAYFVDAFVNWNDPELGRALVSVMTHNNIEVLVPENQQIAGMSLISGGAIPHARRLAEHNVEILAEWVRQGYDIVTTEPSAALALSHEYRMLLDDPDCELVANKVVDAATYLWRLHQEGQLELDFRPMNASLGYHLPCHQRALGEDVPALRLLKLIPGLQVVDVKAGCSGMAGTWGLRSKNYHRSLRMGLSLINAIRSPNIQAGTTECSTCKMQMEQGTTKPTIHPIKILARAYGVLPELDDLLQRRSEELVIS